MQQKRSLILILCLVARLGVFAQNEDAIVGTYMIDEGDSKVEIFRSDKGISGKVVWLKKEENGEGPVLDKRNDDATLRNRPVMGLVVFEGLKYKNDKWTGNIYSPRKGEFYDATFVINEETGVLNLKIKIAFFTVNRYWSRV